MKEVVIKVRMKRVTSPLLGVSCGIREKLCWVGGK